MVVVKLVVCDLEFMVAVVFFLIIHCNLPANFPNLKSDERQFGLYTLPQPNVPEDTLLLFYLLYICLYFTTVVPFSIA